MHTLHDTELTEWLKTYPEWSQEGTHLSVSYTFKNFVEAFGFISKVAIEMEKANHHATITTTYNKVKISMTTHDANNMITNRDTDLAETITKLPK
ncbi:MAG: 4a-hydroxytetrahydrobiopterin dehydratase [Alphaproteobacteria bacterium]|nr:4a-hydroxytetrahydrobiopterin dehydratase [Alphaproteobacteria bacterium]